MDLQTKARPTRRAGRTGGRRTGGRRAGGRRAAALAGIVLAVGAAAGCGGSPAPGSDGAATARPSAEAGTASPAASPSPAATAAEPGPAGSPTSPTATSVPRPGTGATTAPAPDGTGRPGIATGEPAPVPGGRQTISYQVSGNRLTVWFYGGICEKYGLKVDEGTAGRVGVRIVVTTPVPPGQACAAIAQRQSVTAELAKPLMGRTVLDTDRGAEVPLESDYHGGPDPAAR